MLVQKAIPDEMAICSLPNLTHSDSRLFFLPLFVHDDFASICPRDDVPVIFFTRISL